MSSQQHQNQPQRLGARGNWWGEDDDPDNDDRDQSDPRTRLRQSDATNDRHEWIAHKILKRGGDLVSRTALFEDAARDDNLHDRQCLDPMGDPEIRVPEIHPTGYCRASERFGYVERGGELRDRPLEDFVAVVEEVIAAVDVHVRRHRVRDILSFARTQKRAADGPCGSDEAILAEILRELENPGHLDFDAARSEQ